MFDFVCPNCGKELEAEEAWRGLETQCPVCNHNITIPKKIQLQLEPDCLSDPVVNGSMDCTENKVETVQEQLPVKKKVNMIAYCVALIVGILLLIPGCILLSWLKSNSQGKLFSQLEKEYSIKMVKIPAGDFQMGSNNCEFCKIV